MKILISGDPHGKANNLVVFQQYLDELLELQNNNGIIGVVILGDLFNSHAVIRSEVLNVWAEYFRKVEIPHYILKGNHDETAPGSGVHALVAFEAHEKVTVIDKPTAIGSWTLMPFLKTEEFIKNLIPSKHLLFCHQTFEGAQFENGFYAPGGVPIESVKDFQLVVGGDIHKEQQISNVWYPGTPYQMNFNDAGEQKGVWILDTATLERTKIKLKLPQYFIKECESLDNIEDYFLGADLNGKYKIILKTSRSAVRAIQDSSEFKELKKKYHITLSPQYIDVQNATIKINDSISPEKMMEEYVNKIMKTELDRDTLLDKSLEILKGVQL